MKWRYSGSRSRMSSSRSKKPTSRVRKRWKGKYHPRPHARLPPQLAVADETQLLLRRALVVQSKAQRRPRARLHRIAHHVGPLIARCAQFQDWAGRGFGEADVAGA